MSSSIPILILAGGKGTRLASVVQNVPKPMAPIAETPFLAHLIDFFKQQGFKRFIFMVSHLREIIHDYFGDGTQLGVSIDYSVETKALGTGGAVKQAFDNFALEEALVVNGDTFFDLDLNQFMQFKRGGACLALAYRDKLARYGAVKESAGKVVEFVEKGQRLDEGYINAGVYYLHKKVVDNFPSGTSSIENDVFPKLVKKSELYCFLGAGRFIDIGIPEDYSLADKKLPAWLNEEKRGALFLDRDGILVEDTGYLHTLEEMHFVPEVISLVQWAAERGLFIIMVTNQAGVAKGYFDMTAVDTINQAIETCLEKEGLRFDAIYVCPYHPSEGHPPYLRESCLRKPSPGMILRACSEFRIDLNKSLMVGDKESDIIDLNGLKSYLIRGRYPLNEGRGERIFDSICELVEYLNKDGQ